MSVGNEKTALSSPSFVYQCGARSFLHVRADVSLSRRSESFSPLAARVVHSLNHASVKPMPCNRSVSYATHHSTSDFGTDQPLLSSSPLAPFDAESSSPSPKRCQTLRDASTTVEERSWQEGEDGFPPFWFKSSGDPVGEEAVLSAQAEHRDTAMRQSIRAENSSASLAMSPIPYSPSSSRDQAVEGPLRSTDRTGPASPLPSLPYCATKRTTSVETLSSQVGLTIRKTLREPISAIPLSHGDDEPNSVVATPDMTDVGTHTPVQQHPQLQLGAGGHPQLTPSSPQSARKPPLSRATEPSRSSSSAAPTPIAPRSRHPTVRQLFTPANGPTVSQRTSPSSTWATPLQQHRCSSSTAGTPATDDAGRFTGFPTPVKLSPIPTKVYSSAHSSAAASASLDTAAVSGAGGNLTGYRMVSWGEHRHGGGLQQPPIGDCPSTNQDVPSVEERSSNAVPGQQDTTMRYDTSETPTERGAWTEDDSECSISPIRARAAQTTRVWTPHSHDRSRQHSSLRGSIGLRTIFPSEVTGNSQTQQPSSANGDATVLHPNFSRTSSLSREETFEWNVAVTSRDEGNAEARDLATPSLSAIHAPVGGRSRSCSLLSLANPQYVRALPVPGLNIRVLTAPYNVPSQSGIIRVAKASNVSQKCRASPPPPLSSSGHARRQRAAPLLSPALDSASSVSVDTHGTPIGKEFQASQEGFLLESGKRVSNVVSFYALSSDLESENLSYMTHRRGSGADEASMGPLFSTVHPHRHGDPHHSVFPTPSAHLTHSWMKAGQHSKTFIIDSWL